MIKMIEIERATSAETKTLQQIGRQTFFETFSSNNDEENMSKYLEESFALDQLNAELNESGSQFYFAIIAGEVIGYLKLNTGSSQTELREHQGLEIERIYVLQRFHGRKVGQALYEKALEIAFDIRADYVWLGVWEENPKAISFYKKNGFVEFDKHPFMLGNEEQTDIMMKKMLK